VTPTVSSPSRTANFTRFAWGVLAANLMVILWGAFVRASGSGAGCGSHWPLCNGEVVPHSPQVQTIIEFTHRIMSGVAMIGVIGLAIWSNRLFPAGHWVRKAALYSILFFGAEVLLGAGLVVLQLVGKDASGFRAFYLSLHLVNTEFLLAALALAAWFSRDPSPAWPRPSSIVAVALPLAILVSVTGVIAALGDTLFPAASLAEGIRQDLSSNSSFLIRLRGAHPFLAVFSAAYFIAAAYTVLRRKPVPLTTHIALGVVILSIAQLCAGAVNIALLAPIPVQILHLLLADLLWIALVLLTVQNS
jgi:cytochrome c oxidase assembly protein subunit 15